MVVEVSSDGEHAPPPATASPGLVAAWVLAARPKTLPAAAAPVLVGTACAAAVDGFATGPAAAALAGALLLQIAANFSNDVFDFERGADTGERTGPTRVVQAGILRPLTVKLATAIALLLALGVGIYLTVVAGWPVVVIGLASIAAALAYTGGPYPLGYHGLGDLAVLIFFGFAAVCGTAYVQAGVVPGLAWWAALPVGALATAILVVNNLRDRETDARAGKRTLAVRFGRGGAIAEYVGLLTVAYAVPGLLVITERLTPAGLLPLLSLPIALLLLARIRSSTGGDLNPALGGTAGLLFVHALLFTIAIIVGA